MSLSLSSTFSEFCEYLDGKLKWSREKDSVWTAAVFDFFATIKPSYCSESRDHMLVDYLWRDSNNGEIVLAVEHENQESAIQELLASEFQHLLDLKAIHKIAIVYPSSGDEEPLLYEFSRRLRNRLYRLAIGNAPVEDYLVIVGHSTTSERKPAMQWNGHRFRANGERERLESRVILQKS